MGRRYKTRFERWFSILQHKRRTGADNLSSLISSDFKSQKTQIISGNEVVYTHGSSQSLEEHFNALKMNLLGSQNDMATIRLAKIIVLIRRDFKAKNNFQLFEQLWKQEKSFLLKNINTRWLASAADTFADYSYNDAIKGLSIACTCLLNTVKIQESERFLTNAEFYQDDKIKKTKLTIIIDLYYLMALQCLNLAQMILLGICDGA